MFDALRDTIYSEVASMIALNEQRPHFLVREREGRERERERE